MPIPTIEQPEILPISESLRLRRYDGAFSLALPWYQDGETVWLVDGDRRPYTLERLRRMYEFLDARGELYWIELRENGTFRPAGDVTFWQEDMPIVLGDPGVRGRGIGRQVVEALCRRGAALGYRELFVSEIYDWNSASRRCFEGAGFQAYEKTERGWRFRKVL